MSVIGRNFLACSRALEAAALPAHVENGVI
jgi:hypothetical protein